MDDYFADQDILPDISYGISELAPQHERVSIRSLMQMIDEYQQTEQSSTLQRLEEENAILQKQVSCYQRSWHTTLELLEGAFEAVLLIQRSLDDCNTEVDVAKKGWLAFWGIYMETPAGLKYPLPDWI